MDKRCFKCGQTRPRTEFYAHPATADGLLGKCKDCARQDALARHHAQPEKVKGYLAKVRGTPRFKALKKKHNALYHRRHPEKATAHEAVRKAIKAGTLAPKPCERCGKKKGVEAHHPDYSKPLDVVWLCKKHHVEVHLY